MENGQPDKLRCRSCRAVQLAILVGDAGCFVETLACEACGAKGTMEVVPKENC
jgi:transcription elongation factor Elf1